MKYLNKKFRKDSFRLLPQFISVIIMCMLSIAIYCGMSAVWTGMARSYGDYKNTTKLADVCVTATHADSGVTDRISELPYVREAEGSLLVKYNASVGRMQSDIYVYSFKKSTTGVLDPLIRSGKKLDEQGEGLWIDEDYAKAHGLKIGDVISIEFNGSEYDAEISGTVLDAENIYFVTSYSETVPDHTAHGYAYMSEKFAEKILGGISYNQIRIALSDKDISDETLQKDIKGIMGDSFLSLVRSEDKISVRQVEDEIVQIRKMAMLFSFVFILLSVLSIYTTMSRLISKQIVQIGTFKALGFYDRQIYLHYGLYGFSVAVLGSALGLLVGYSVVADLVMKIKRSTLTLPTWDKVVGGDSILLILLIILVCTMAAVITTRRVVKNNPSLTIRGVMERKSDMTKKQKRTRYSFDVIWTIRSMKMHPVRTAMSITAIVGSIVLMVAGLGVWDSLYDSYDKVYKEEFRYRYVGQVSRASYEELRKTFEEYNAQLAQTRSADFTYREETEEGALFALEPGDLIRLFDAETGEAIDLERETAVVTAQMADKLSVAVGDRIEYKTSDTSAAHSIVVSAVADAKMPQGLFVSKDRLESFDPNTIYIGDARTYYHAADNKSISNIMSIGDQRNNMREMMDSVHSIMYILILAAFILSAVILYNLGILSCLERYREYATMKVIGFYNGEINALIIKESILHLLIGLFIGIPLSIYFLKLYVSIVSMDNMEWTPAITGGHFLLVIASVVCFTLLIDLIVFSRVRRVDMVESLKTVE